MKQFLIPNVVVSRAYNHMAKVATSKPEAGFGSSKAMETIGIERKQYIVSEVLAEERVNMPWNMGRSGSQKISVLVLYLC